MCRHLENPCDWVRNKMVTIWSQNQIHDVVGYSSPLFFRRWFGLTPSGLCICLERFENGHGPTLTLCKEHSKPAQSYFEALVKAKRSSGQLIFMTVWIMNWSSIEYELLHHSSTKACQYLKWEMLEIKIWIMSWSSTEYKLLCHSSTMTCQCLQWELI